MQTISGFPGHHQDLMRRWVAPNGRIRTWKILSSFRDAIADGSIVGFDGFGSLKFGLRLKVPEYYATTGLWFSGCRTS